MSESIPAILKKLEWVRVGSTIQHKCGGEYEVMSQDGSGWWLKRLWCGETEWYSRGDVLLCFEPALPKTRFQRVNNSNQ